MSKLDNLNVPSGGDDGEWIFSYADLMSLLMCFFIILFSMSNMDEKKKGQVEDALSDYFHPDKEKVPNDYVSDFDTPELRSLFLLLNLLDAQKNPESISMIQEAMADQSKFKQLEGELSASLKDNPWLEKYIRSETHKQHTIEFVLPEKILFETGQVSLSPTAEEKISAIAAILKDKKDISEISIVGHTDSSQPGKNSKYISNFTISSIRAGAVAEVFKKQGFPNMQLKVSGMADLDPIVPDRDKNGEFIPINQSKNRRVHIVVTLNKKD